MIWDAPPDGILFYYVSNYFTQYGCENWRLQWNVENLDLVLSVLAVFPHTIAKMSVSSLGTFPTDLEAALHIVFFFFLWVKIL